MGAAGATHLASNVSSVLGAAAALRMQCQCLLLLLLLQGCDHMHGCYGGTSALLTVADWVASPSWDGRLGLVVATDIAVYPPASPARPTGAAQR